jgi:hypothetical protein
VGVAADNDTEKTADGGTGEDGDKRPDFDHVSSWLTLSSGLSASR